LNETFSICPCVGKPLKVPNELFTNQEAAYTDWPCMLLTVRGASGNTLLVTSCSRKASLLGMLLCNARAAGMHSVLWCRKHARLLCNAMQAHSAQRQKGEQPKGGAPVQKKRSSSSMFICAVLEEQQQ